MSDFLALIRIWRCNFNRTSLLAKALIVSKGLDLAKATGIAEEQSARVENDSYVKEPTATQYRGALERKISTLQAKLPQAPLQASADKSREPQAYHHPQDTYAEQAPVRAQIDPRIAPTSQHHSELLQQRARAAQANAPGGAVGRSQNAVAPPSSQQQMASQHQPSSQQAHPSYAPQGPARAVMQIPASRDPHGNFALQQQQQQYAAAAAKNEMNMSTQQQGTQASQQAAYRMPGTQLPGVTNYGHMQSQPPPNNPMGGAQPPSNQQQANMMNHQRQNPPPQSAAQAAAAKRGAAPQHNPNMLPTNAGHSNTGHPNNAGMMKLPAATGVPHMPGATTAAGTAKYASNPSYGQQSHPGMYNTQQAQQQTQQTANRGGNMTQQHQVQGSQHQGAQGQHQGAQGQHQGHGMVMSGAASTASLQQQHQPMHSNHVAQHAPPAAHHPQTQQHNQHNQAHGNQAHGNQAHGNQAHTNQSHGNQAHGNQSHGNQQQPPQQQQSMHPNAANAKMGQAAGNQPAANPPQIAISSQNLFDVWIMLSNKAQSDETFQEPLKAIGLKYSPGAQLNQLTLPERQILAGVFVRSKAQMQQKQAAAQLSQQQAQQAHAQQQQNAMNAAPHRPQQAQGQPIMQDTRNLQDQKMYSTMAPGIPQNVRQPANPGMTGAGPAGHPQSMPSHMTAAQAAQAKMATNLPAHFTSGGPGGAPSNAPSHHPPNGSAAASAASNAPNANTMQQRAPHPSIPTPANAAVANATSTAARAAAAAPANAVAAASNASLANAMPASAAPVAPTTAAPTNATQNAPPLTPEEARNALAVAVSRHKDLNRTRTLALKIRESLSPTAPLPLPDLLPLLPETPWWERPKRRLTADNTKPAESHLIESQIVSYKSAKLREGALPKSSGIPTALLLATSLVNEGDQMMQDMKEIRDEIAALSGGDQSFTSTLIQLDLTLLRPSKPHVTSSSSSNGLCRACTAHSTLKESQVATGTVNTASASFESGPSSASSQMAVDGASDSTHRNIFGCGTAHRSAHSKNLKSSHHEQCCTPALLIDFRAPSSDIPLPAVLAPNFTALGCRFGRSFAPVLRTLQRKYCPSFTLSTSNNKWTSVSSPLPPTARSLHASRSAVTTPHPPSTSVTSPPSVMPSNISTPNPAAVSTPLGSETGSQKSGAVSATTPSASAAAHSNAESLRSDRVYAAKKYVRIVLECWKAWIGAVTAFEEELALPEFHDVQFEESIRRTTSVALSQEHASAGVSESADRKQFSRTDDSVKIEIGIIFSLKPASGNTNTSTTTSRSASSSESTNKANDSSTLPNLFLVLPVDYPRALIDTVGIETSDANVKARLYSIIGQLNAPTVSEILNVWLRFGNSLSHASPRSSLNSSQESPKMDISYSSSDSSTKKPNRYLKNGFAHKTTFGHSNALIRTSRPIPVQRR